MNTHYVVYDAYIPITDENLHYKSMVNFEQLLNKVGQEGYFPDKNLDILKDRLVFHMDNGELLIVHLCTLH